MRPLEWNRARSDFNHGWLKNRLIVTLYRAQRILSGAVLDDTGLDVLKNLLAEWPERFREAVELIRHHASYSSMSAQVESDAEADYAAVVSFIRRQEEEKPEIKGRLATETLDVLDKEIHAAKELSTANIQRLIDKARRLADAISSLSLLSLPSRL